MTSLKRCKFSFRNFCFRIYSNISDTDLNDNKIFSVSVVESRSEVAFVYGAFINIISRMGFIILSLTLWDPKLHGKRQ
jgi:hypothetical protein